MGIEFQILDALQKIHTPILDKCMAAITSLGNAGIIWIILAAVLLIYPKTRKTGIIVAAALIVDLILCNVILKNLIARTRPYDINTAVQIIIAKPHDYSFPSGHTAASFASVAALYLAGAKKRMENCRSFGSIDCIFKIIFLCTFSNRCVGWNCVWNPVRCDWV